MGPLEIGILVGLAVLACTLLFLFVRYRNTDFVQSTSVHAVLFVVQCIFAGGAVFSRFALKHNGFEPSIFAFCRVSLAIPTMTIAWLIEKHFHTKETERRLIEAEKGFVSKKEPLLSQDAPWSDIAKLGVLGCMGFSGNILLCMYAVKLSSADTVGIFSSTMPIFCTISALLLRKEATTVLKIVGTLISFGGAVMQFINVGSDPLRTLTPTPSPVGNLTLMELGATDPTDNRDLRIAQAMLLINYFSLGLFVVFLKDFTKKYCTYYTMSRALSFGVIPILIVAACHYDSFPFLWSGKIPLKSWAAVVYTGAVLSVFPFTLMGWALRRASPVLVGVYVNLQPVITAILSFLFLGEELQWFHALGGVVIIIGVLFVTFGKSAAEKELIAEQVAARRAALKEEEEERLSRKKLSERTPLNKGIN